MRFSRIDIAILLAIILTLVTSCGRAMSERLDHIESIIQEYPDSALVQLSSIDTSELFTRRHKAQYALLLTMARDKNDLDILDQNLISPAVSYYRHHRSHDHYAAALFYSGRIAFYNFDYPNALIRCMEALDYAKGLYWRAMINSEIARIYNASYNPSEELKYSGISLSLWREYNDQGHIVRALGNYATALHNNRKKEQADSVLMLLINRPDPHYVAYLQIAQNEITSNNPDYDKVVNYYNLANTFGEEFTEEDYYEYAYALSRIGKLETADNILSQLSSLEESVVSCHWLRKLAEDKGDYKAALSYEKRFSQLSDTLVREQLHQSVFKAQSAYYSHIADENKHRYIMVLMMLFMSIFLLLSAILLFYNIVRIRKQRWHDDLERIYSVAEEAEYMLHLSESKNRQFASQFQKAEESLVELRRSFARAYKRQFEDIGRVLNHLGSSPSEFAARQYVRNVEEILKEIANDGHNNERFEERINKDAFGIMSKLRADFPNFSEDDFRFLSFLIVGFDATTRAILLNSTQNNMRVKKFRLLEKIAASDSPNMELYRCFLFENTKNHYSDTN